MRLGMEFDISPDQIDLEIWDGARWIVTVLSLVFTVLAASRYGRI